ncbi:LysR family transcriptional regulator [Arthrobacter zhaoxinii]|uniref:LysR family transcriptional regulator n=1 Tax=Arthrobacter zhaoxinii TaxID=2964616 RepID=A0ABY5YTU6_9MICC|nr:LysR family transcriptional regulator [Arthrobacter zhaoxinii]UWX98546.1 LysR family transcriptional regulator [Arthrobacter zhaoxinii]
MKNMDLNLLPLLQVLLEVRNVTRTAERLKLSQPATSAALAKLRRHFDDELLVRSGRHYELTPFAQALVPVVDEAMLQIRRATRIRSGFEPLTSTRGFTISASDYASALIVGPLRRILREEAPGVSVDFVPNSGFTGQLAELTRTDLLVGPVGYGMQGTHRELFRDGFVAVTGTGNELLARESLTLQDLASVPQAVGYIGDGILTPADRLFDDRGLKRNTAAVVSGFLALPTLVEDTDLVALVPRMLAARSQRGADIAILELADSGAAALVEALYWHPSLAEDPAGMWLRSVVHRACYRLPEQWPARVHPVAVGLGDARVTYVG